MQPRVQPYVGTRRHPDELDHVASIAQAFDSLNIQLQLTIASANLPKQQGTWQREQTVEIQLEAMAALPFASIF